MSPLHLLSGAGTQNTQREAQLQKQARGSEYHTDAREHGACLLLLLQVCDDPGCHGGEAPEVLIVWVWALHPWGH